MGTGTTAIGCLIENINYIGSEISSRYVECSNKRINALKSQIKLF
jgi:DNA modification methylase